MKKRYYRALVVTEDRYLKEIFEEAGYKNDFIMLEPDKIFGIKPDLIILDLSTNVDLVKFIKENFDVDDVPMIAIINITQVADKKTMDFDSIKSILVKPATLEEVTNKLELFRNFIDSTHFRRMTEVLYREEIERLLEIEYMRFKRYEIPFSFLIIKLDDFERLSELKGPQNMDNLFKEISKILKNMLRNSDFVGRFSEDKFAVILTNTNIKGSISTAQRIQKRIRRHRFSGFSDLNITVSIGISQASKEFESYEELINAAMLALSKAMRNKKNKIVPFEAWNRSLISSD